MRTRAQRLSTLGMAPGDLLTAMAQATDASIIGQAYLNRFQAQLDATLLDGMSGG